MWIRLIAIWLSVSANVLAQLDFEKDPINYSRSTPTDPVQQLADRLDNDQVQLQWNNSNGYLASLLNELKIPQSSQTLVFSKTSLQVSRISPRTPRAIYFNDDIYVGWVQRSDMIEISAADSALGATFYSLNSSRETKPVIKRETSRCLQCHGSTHTRRIPGHIVRSVYPDKSGQPVFRMGTHLSSPDSPFSERFGGWYVTGQHGESKHMGNAWVTDPDESETLGQEHSFNVSQLKKFVSTKPYLTPHSDLLALLVLQHQVHVHNVLTAANHSGMLTERDALVMNRALEREPDYESDSTKRRYASAADKVVKALLCADESPLPESLSGTSDFQTEFQAKGPFDAKGRSLRQLQAGPRLFRYPCSFLIYSKPFAHLHPEVKRQVQGKLLSVLSSPELAVPDFPGLTPELRAEVLQILQATDALPLAPGAQPSK